MPRYEAPPNTGQTGLPPQPRLCLEAHLSTPLFGGFQCPLKPEKTVGLQPLAGTPLDALAGGKAGHANPSSRAPVCWSAEHSDACVPAAAPQQQWDQLACRLGASGQQLLDVASLSPARPACSSLSSSVLFWPLPWAPTPVSGGAWRQPRSALGAMGESLRGR